MGKNLIQQRRGKGSSTFRAHGFRGKGEAKSREGQAVIRDITHSRMHSAPLLRVKYEDGTAGLMIAPEGVKVGETIGAPVIATGSTLRLKDIPQGTLIHNIEAAPGDGGKFVRGSGTVARVLASSGNSISVLLPSKKKKDFHPDCKATIGTVAGGGRPEKPLMKAGITFHKMKAKNRYWPKVSGAAMNAVAHPFGGKRSSRKGRPTISPRNAPPGRMVGMIRPRKTGRARGTRERKS